MKTFKESQTKTLLIFQNCDHQKHFLTPLSDSAHNTTSRKIIFQELLCRFLLKQKCLKTATKLFISKLFFRSFFNYSTMARKLVHCYKYSTIWFLSYWLTSDQVHLLFRHRAFVRVFKVSIPSVKYCILWW